MARRAVTDQIIWTDVSEWQAAAYDDSYPWPVAAYRMSSGANYVDAKGATNAAWCHRAFLAGKLIGHIGYHVWAPGNEQAQADRFFALLGANADAGFVAMIDVESWSGQITGDHSAQVQALADAMAARLNSVSRVKIYGNSGDLAAIAPRVSGQYGRIKAGYSSVAPAEPWDGWQYSDGQSVWPIPAGAVRSSPPFGGCDHNIFYGTAADWQSTYGIGDSMSAQEVADLKAYIDQKIAALAKSVGDLGTLILYGDGRDVPANKNTHPVNLRAAITGVQGIPAPPSPAEVAAAVKADPPAASVQLTPEHITAIVDGLIPQLAKAAPEYSVSYTASPQMQTPPAGTANG
jgi:hypothetical protein